MTVPSDSLAPLFAPIQVGALTIPSRIVVAAMERSYANTDGTVTRRMIAHYEAVTRGGPGLVTVESAYIDWVGANRRHQLGIQSDACIAGLRDLVTVIHRHGAKATIQLQHAGRNSRPVITGLTPVAPSAVLTPYGDISHALTVDEIAAVIEQYRAAARRAAEAGFDAIELHSAHGYLPQAFLSRVSNHRDDEYGGSLENRMRFGVDIAKALRDEVGDRVTLGCRVSALEYLPDGLEVEETSPYARALVAAGCEYVSVSAGTHASFKYVIPPMDVPSGWLLPTAARIRDGLGVPVIGASRITDPAVAAHAIAAGQVDMVAMGRAFLTDPEWPRKARAGQPDTIVSCIGCNQGCTGRIKDGRDVTCLVNPGAGRELEFEIVPAATPRRVAVIGGGPAGMEAARVAAERGHEVVLHEAGRELGGKARLAAVLPHRQGWQTYVEEAERRLRRSTVEVRLESFVGPDELMRLEADAIVIATGAEFTREHAGALVTDVVAVLESGDVPGSNAVVVGGTIEALGVAEWLLDRGLEVTLVAREAEVVEPLEQLGLLARLRGHPTFATLVERTVRSVSDRVVCIGWTGAIGPLLAETIVDVDAVVFADRRRPSDGLGWLAGASGLAAEIHTIGDGRRPGDALQAILDGATTGRAL
jgi:2,4-dienoyl-CoA reductase-like NADH-dependent reductase (Old Yellow Enzyme family)